MEAEDNQSTTFDIYFEGTLVEDDYISGAAGHWEKLGPWTATITDGTLAIDTIGGHANLSGIEVWQVSSGATNTPTPTSAATTSTPTPTATSTPTGTPTSSGLVAAYNFDAGSGTSLADVTGNGHIGTLVNGPSWTTQGRYGGALSFDGENNLVSIADANDLDLTTDMTLEVWVYPTEELQGWRSVLLKGQSVDLVYAIYANSDGSVPSGWVYIDGEKVATGADALATDTWTHLATTFDGSTIRLYVNGTQVGSTSVSGSITVSDEALELGGDTVWAEFFTGRLDDVRIYNRALSATEIQSDMNTAVSGSLSLGRETVRAVAPSTNQASSQTTATKTQVPNDYPATRVHERAVQPHTESAFSESQFSLSNTSWMKVAAPDLPNSLTLNTILPQTAPLTTTRTITYEYDGHQHLTGAFESPDSSYVYTGVWVNGTQIQNRTYNAANQVSGWTYDAAGNLLSDGTSTYAYDALGRVTTLNGTTNTYNGDGVLVAQTSGSTTTNYTQDLAAPLSQILSDGTNRYVYGNPAERLFGTTGSTRTWYATDALGTVRASLNEAGIPQAVANYDPWGVPETSTIAPFGFTGELQQGNNVYLRARWYGAGYGVFTAQRWQNNESRDTMPYSHHVYAYALSNPLAYTDPTGKHVPNLEPDGDARDLTGWLYREMSHNLTEPRLQKIRLANSVASALSVGITTIRISCDNLWIPGAMENVKNGIGLTVLELGLSPGKELTAAVLYAYAGKNFYDLVKDRGPWDFKHRILQYLGPGIKLDKSSNIEYSVPGNIHFGYVAAAAGYFNWEIQAGAGIAEIKDPAHNPNSANYLPYTGRFDVGVGPSGSITFNLGDDPSDNWAVTFGIELYRKYGQRLTYTTFKRELRKVIPGLSKAEPRRNPVDGKIAAKWPYPVGYFDPTR